MVLAVLTACSKQESQNNATANGEEEPWDGNMDNVYVIEILTENPPIESSLDTEVGRYIAEKFGIAFEYSGYSGDIIEKQATLLAGGDYSPMQYMQYEQVVRQYIDAGALINLDDYKDLLPDFYERFEDSIKYWRASSPDGGLYKWEANCPNEDTYHPVVYDVMVRSDILEYYGWPEIVTASDWADFLKQAMIDFPTTYDGQSTVGLSMPLAESWGLSGSVAELYEKGDQYLAVSNEYYIYDAKNEQFVDYLLNPYVKESFQFYNDLYKSGVLDPEAFTDTQDNMTQKMSNGRAIAAYYATWLMGTANEALIAAGHPEMQYVHLPIQADSQAAEGQGRAVSAVYSFPYDSWGITTNCEYPERLMKLINWCCTDEGQMVLQCGLEDVHYTINEEGQRELTDLGLQCITDLETNKEAGMNCFSGLPLCVVNAEDGMPYNLSREPEVYDELNLTERQREAYDAMGWDSSYGWWIENAVWYDSGYSMSCALDTTTDLGKTGQKMTEVRTKYAASLIMSDDFETTWEEVMTEYDKLDHEAVIQAMNDRLAELKAAEVE